MKKSTWLCILMVFLMIFQTVPPVSAVGTTSSDRPAALIENNFETDFQVQAKAGALVELNTNTMVYGYELDTRVYPASLTKIMTCMLAIRNGKMDDVLTVSDAAYDDLVLAGSTAGLKAGEELTLEEVLYCVMVSSANEACNVVAEYVSGSREAFVELMNQQAAALGMTNTHYVNTHGLHEDEHYTTVRDLTTLARWAWNDAKFREFATCTEHIVPATNRSEERTLRTTNYLTSRLVITKYYYDKASGMKTGFTTPAGGCLISTAEDDDMTFLSVVCGCETLQNEDGSETDMRFTETKRMFEYGFENFSYVQVLSDTMMVDMPKVLYAKGRDTVVVRSRDNCSVLLPVDYDADMITQQIHYDGDLEAPLSAGQKVGTVSVVYQGMVLASSDLVTLTAVEKSQAAYVGDKTEEAVGSVWSSIWRVWYITVPLLLILCIVIWLLIMRQINIRKAKKRAARRREREERRNRQ